MATASALSFMLEGLRKPVILTGSQLPIGIPRTDGRENLDALMLAVDMTDGEPTIQEVAVYFGNHLFRGNRTHKESAQSLQAPSAPTTHRWWRQGWNSKSTARRVWRPQILECKKPSCTPGIRTEVAWVPLFQACPRRACAELWNGRI